MAYRGNFRGGRARGQGRGRGKVVSTGRVARSGIKTKNGYKKFDSQRIKEVDSSDLEEDQNPDQQDDGDASDESNDDESLQESPKLRAYNALLQSFQTPAGEAERRAKRRKLNFDKEPGSQEPHDHSHISEDPGLEVVELLAEDVVQDEDEAAAEKGHANDDPDDGKEEEEDLSEPYEAHFAVDGTVVQSSIKNLVAGQWSIQRELLKDIGHLTSHALRVSEESSPRTTTGDITTWNLKNRLKKSSGKLISSFHRVHRALMPYIATYSDLLVGNRTPHNARGLRYLGCIHALNHVLKGRDKVLRNTARLSRAEVSEELDLRDQGFTRPKVLILLETRQMAAKYADCIADLFDPEQQENKQRFKDSFMDATEDRNDMPEDYHELFDGNNDNNFLTAMKFTRKALKYFSAFYNSDIIIASPLGLRRVIEHEDSRKRDHDFLSSIEVLIVDQADAMQMQNWENVELVFKHLNLQLREAHGCDFNRVRHWYLDGNAKHLRQTIIFSGYITPELNRLYNTSMLNIGGKAKLAPTYEGAIASLSGTGLKQTFSRFDSLSPANDPNTRFKYFTTAVLSRLLRLPKPADGAQGILIFIPSYFDFVRIRNYFATSTQTENISFGAIHDYSEVSDQRRARSHFTSGRHSMLLYTQRAHHFFRLRLRGVKRVVMYGLPDNPIFYQELVGGFLGTALNEGRVSAEEGSVRAMFSKWDGLKLERVAGSNRVKSMLNGQGDTFDFV